MSYKRVKYNRWGKINRLMTVIARVREPNNNCWIIWSGKTTITSGRTTWRQWLLESGNQTQVLNHMVRENHHYIQENHMTTVIARVRHKCWIIWSGKTTITSRRTTWRQWLLESGNQTTSVESYGPGKPPLYPGKPPDDSDCSTPGTKQQVLNHMVRENHDIRENHELNAE